MVALPAILQERYSSYAPHPQSHHYQPHGASLHAWLSGKREVLLSGPANTGKTRGNLEKLHFCAKKYAGMRGLMLRKTRQSLTQSAMVTYEHKVLSQAWRDAIHFDAQDQQYEYPNGSIIAVAGLDDPQKVMSSEWDFILAIEATELREGDWQALTIRLRNKVMPYQQLLGDCNPGGPTHWLKRRCDRGATLMLESRHEDNPSITAEDIATLDALTGIWYLRYRKGIWAAAEGLVYDDWDRSQHIVSKQQLIKWNLLYEDGRLNRTKVRHVLGGVDWGFTNPGVLHVYLVDNDGRMYLFREVYRTKRTIDWWIIEARKLQDMWGVERWICDPAEPAYIQQFNRAGLSAVGAVNDIAPGIGFLQARLKPAGDGRPRFYVYEYALEDRDESLEQAHKPYCFEQEIDAYVWAQSADGKPQKETPVDDANHALDCARYLANQLAKRGFRTVDTGIMVDLYNYTG